MKKFLIGVLLLILFIVVGYVLNENYLGQKNSQDALVEIAEEEVETIDNYISVTGLVGYSGLTFEDKDMLGLLYSDIQVDNINRESALLPNPAIQGVFIEKEDLNTKFLAGKCLLVTGEVKDGWLNGEQLMGTNKYKRVAVEPFSLTILGFDKCKSYPVSADSAMDKDTVSLTGRIDRNVRPYPDVDYDYKIVLPAPIKLIEDTSGFFTKKVSEIPIVPANYQVRIALEEKIDKKAEIEGVAKWGYAESQYVLVLSVK